MTTSTRLARLTRLEALESAVRYPTTMEFHRAVPVAADDRRRGSYVIEANQITFFSHSAEEYEAASAAYTAGRHIILISVDPKCVFKQEEAAQ